MGLAEESPGRRRASVWRYRFRRQLPLILLLAAAAPFPLFGPEYHIGLIARFMCFSILAVSFDLMWGYAGVISFGHAIFFGFGAYAMGISLRELGSEAGSAVGIVLALVVPAAAALFLGLFLFYSRVSGIYFGIVTLALAVALEQAFIAMRGFTGGLDGLLRFPHPVIGIPGLGAVEIWGVRPPYFVALVGLVATLAVARWIAQSDFGVAMRGLRDDEERMEFLGFSKAKMKTVVLVITAAMAGFGGAIYVSIAYVNPALVGISFSTETLMWVALGGRGTLWGPIVGVFFVGYLETILSGAYQNIWPLFIGITFILVVLIGRNGIIGLLPRGWFVRRHGASGTKSLEA